MEFEKLINLIGYSVYSPEFKGILDEFNVKDIPVAEIHGYFRDGSSDLRVPSLYNKEFNVEFGFYTRIRCDDEDFKFLYTNDKYELIVAKVSFWSMSGGIAYPFGLLLGDDDKTVAKKLNEKPYMKSKGHPNGFCYWYYKDNLELIAKYDNNKLLGNFSFTIQDQLAKKSARLRRTIKEQKNNLTKEHMDALRSLVSDLPTKAWTERMLEDTGEGEASPFTTENILAAETVLKEFLISLETAVEKNKVSQIPGAIKKAVVAFNKLNPKNDDFIETLEREELVEFITKAVRLTGFKVEEGTDITDTWREW